MPQKSRPSKSRSKGFTLRPLPEESAEASAPSLPPPAREPFDNLGELPHGYGTDTIFLIAQEPKWLFTYWDIDINRHPGGAAYLRYYLGDGTLAGEIEVPFETRNWYIPVDRPACEYYVEIGYFRGEAWNLIARSIPVTTPPEGIAESEDFDYATIPFHLSFQRLIEHLQSSQASGENLLETLARLQQKGDFSAFGASSIADLLSADQQALLRSLLSPQLLEELASGGLSSGEIEARVRAYFEELLSSGGASETLTSFRETVSALFSGGILSSAGAFGSWEIGALSSWATQAIMSWSAAGAGVWSFGVTTSWSGGVGFSGETSWSGASVSSWSETSSSQALASWMMAGLSSWLAAAASSEMTASLSSWASGAQSSWGQAAQASWFQGVSSSWLQGMQSSWAAAAQSSWAAPEFSSWFSASAVTSWSGASETLASPVGGAREFFMNVNAELIFYGGTDPRAKVTIAGQPIALTPEGTFRYHFVFPNADYDIPVVAESPDGVETRSATLHFHRNTNKVGFVTDTPQPPLAHPMGEVARSEESTLV